LPVSIKCYSIESANLPRSQSKDESIKGSFKCKSHILINKINVQIRYLRAYVMTLFFRLVLAKQ